MNVIQLLLYGGCNVAQKHRSHGQRFLDCNEVGFHGHNGKDNIMNTEAGFIFLLDAVSTFAQLNINM